MFESAELGHRVAKEAYAEEEPKLREALLDAQFDLHESRRFSTVILIGGVEGAGKGETVNTLNAWMDPRQIETTGFVAQTDEERQRPPMWRFWRALPPKGRIAIFFGSWYTDPIVARVLGGAKEAQLDRAIAEIRRFERMLADEGVLLLKFWFHLSKEAQRQRLKELAKDPRTAWRVTKDDRARLKDYDTWREVSERVLRRTSEGHAPWIVVEGADERYRNLTVGRTVLTALRRRLDAPPDDTPPVAPPASPPGVDARNVLTELDLTKAVPKAKYEKELEEWQGRLNLLTRHRHFAEHAWVVVFEGNDAAGKGGAIKRVVGAVDARFLRTVPVAAPTDEEKARPYLWRFWRQIPRHGHGVIFDRSWYGRVLVERVEGFCAEYDWQRAYGEINDFEEELARHGVIVTKFWLAIGREEQARRFKEREETSFKRFKITAEDWRNREKWDQYVEAVCDMIERTSTTVAPWTVVEANDKYHARLKVLKTLVRRMERALEG
ncbi:MAG: polyphosphate:AMP phosphotransferase [Gemmatimonadales bacterium]|nr:polyphosphate:AMP phosphotransferase [Gemmatimonadales bacterium]